MRFRGLAEATAVVLASVALTSVLTYPLAFKIDRVGRLNTDDGRWSIWVVSWVAHALTTDPAGVFQANIFYPQRNALAFSEANLVEGAIGAPVWALTHNPYATHNVVALFSFILSAVGAYYLVRYLTGHRGAAAIAGVLYAFCPFAFARTAHIQLMFTGGIPFCLLAFHRLADRVSVPRAVTLGLALWLQALACAYYGIFAGLMVGLGTLVVAGTRGLWRSREYWVAIGLAAFVSVALTVPFFLPYLDVQRDTGFARTLDDARMYSADAGAWLASSAWAHRWWLSWIEPFNEVLFPGIVSLVLGAAGFLIALRSRPERELVLFYGLSAVLAFWLSFGPDAGLYSVFYKTIPVFSFLRAPGRIGIVVVMCLVVFAGVAVRALLRDRPRAGVWAAAIALVAIAELTQAPLTALREAQPFPAAYRTLAVQPPGVVAEFPYFYQRGDFPRHAIYMLNSATHWMPLVNGYSDHIPQEFRDQVVPLSSFPTRESFRILARVGTRYAMFHLDMYDARSRERLIERIGTYGAYLRPLVQEGDVWLFEIVGFPELAFFTLAAVLHTWPLASAPGTMGRVDNADTALNAWIVAWVGMTLPTAPLRLFDANIFYPEPRTLAFSEVMLPQSLMGAPLTWAGFDPVLVYNLLVIAGFALSGFAMAWVVSRWTGDRAAGVVAGLAYAFNAHTLVRFGHLQALHVQYLPVALCALDLLLREPRWRWGLLLAAMCVLQALTSNYLLVMTAIAMAAAVAVRPEIWRAPQLRTLAGAGALAAVLLAPFLYPYWLAHTQQGLGRTFDDVVMYSATWRDWLATGGTLHYRAWSHDWFGAPSALFPGITVTLMSAAAIVAGTAWRDPRARMALAIGLVGLALSFGANLPGYHALFDVVPILKGIRVVSRFGWMTLFALPILMGFALASLRGRRSANAAAALAVIAGLLVTVEALRAPMGFTHYDGIPRIYDRVAQLNDVVLAEVPFPPREAIQDNGPSVLFSAWHLKPLLNGYSGFTPASYSTHYQVMQGFPTPDSISSLRALGVTHIVVHKRRVPAELLVLAAAAPGLTVVADEGDQLLYSLGTGAR